MEFYDLKIKTPGGKLIKLSDFKGKAVLLVNTATKCNLAPQFDGLEKLHQKYSGKGLVVLGFPSDQFAGQEPETNDTVEEVCRINHGVTFQLTEKINVNGEDAHPIFKFLKAELKSFLGGKISWNFTKFLITPEGEPFRRYSPVTKISRIERDVKRLLEK